MKFLRHILALLLAAVMLLNSAPSVTACGPSSTVPIFVFRESPDLPFEEFTNGKIGILKTSFGRKTLVIAHRYLNGGSFTSDEQKELIDALKGKPPDADDATPLKAWIEERRQFLKEDQKLPEIYTERTYGGYDFFPNCTKNAFEVALQTLKDRSATYGVEDGNVKAWLAAQDMVFHNCSEGTQIPGELGAESPMWLRKDRDYQIAAAHLYSLNFDAARARFEKISADMDSPWQEVAGYLVARTLIRKASLGADEKGKRELYEQAESRLRSVIMSGGKFVNASRKLLALVKYQIHPEERVIELSRTLTVGSNENLRQDLIDYVWLLDKFEGQISKAEAERKEKQETVKVENPHAPFPSQEAKERHERWARGETIEVTMYPKDSEGKQQYSQPVSVEVKHDASVAEVLAAFEQTFGRKLNDEETNHIKQKHEFSVQQRRWLMNPNRKWHFGGLSLHEGCYYDCARLPYDRIPDFLRSDDLSDWIFTTQTEDPVAYNRALSKWRQTGSTAWMLTALMKAETSSPRLAKLIQAADRVTRDDPGFATSAYHVIRLKIAMGHVDEARKRLDEILSAQSELPVSAQNQFLEQHMHLAKGLNEFLKSAQRRPAAFYEYGIYGKVSDMLRIRKNFWNPEYMHKTKEEYESDVEETYKDLLPWDDRVTFDDGVLDIFNWHFPLKLLGEAARNTNLPDYLQRSLVLTVWTRAIVLDNDEVALSIAPEVVKVQPEMSAVFERYLNARTPKERHSAALYVLLKFPDLSPFVKAGLPRFNTAEEIEYNFEESWWCPPGDTDYNEDGNEVPRVIPRPNFLTAEQLETARREHATLVAVGDGKSYLGKRAIAWALTSPADARVPEGLFIAAQANSPYKYPCDSWAFDETTKQQAETILRQRYPASPWTAKLSERPN